MGHRIYSLLSRVQQKTNNKGYIHTRTYTSLHRESGQWSKRYELLVVGKFGRVGLWQFSVLFLQFFFKCKNISKWHFKILPIVHSSTFNLLLSLHLTKPTRQRPPDMPVVKQSEVMNLLQATRKLSTQNRKYVLQVVVSIAIHSASSRSTCQGGHWFT